MFARNIWGILVNKESLCIIFKRNETFWGKVAMAPPDPILGLSEAFQKCTDPKKVNLGVGAYRDDAGKPFVLPSVKKADRLLQAMDLNKEYLPIAGSPEFCKLSIRLALGDDSEHVKNGLMATCQTLSGTGALRLAGDFIKLHYPGVKKLFVSIPTWGNHNSIFKVCGLELGTYKYYDAKTCGLDFNGMMDDVSKIPDKAVILLHACAHNPTGVDPSPQQWDELSKVVKKKNLLSFFDMAYQGFASGDSENDAYALRRFVRDGNPIILAQSYAKNMGLYGERVGALTVQTTAKEETTKVMSQFKAMIRSMYSSPPCNGSRLVTKILEDPELKTEWKKDFKGMSERIKAIRRTLRSNLKKEGSGRNWEHITNQIGMFCFTGLNADQVQKLIKEHFIFLTKNGRISVAGLSSKNVEYVARCMHLVSK